MFSCHTKLAHANAEFRRVTQLLIVKPDMGPLDAANVAATYEMGEFQKSLDRVGTFYNLYPATLKTTVGNV